MKAYETGDGIWYTEIISPIILFFITLALVIFLLFCVNTIYCLICLAGIIFCVFCFLILNTLEFFALIYLLIYVGAIIVFFLFSIMLLHLKFERIFEFEISHSFAMILFLFLNFFIYFFIKVDFSRWNRFSLDSIYQSCFDGIFACVLNMCMRTSMNRHTARFDIYAKTRQAESVLEVLGVSLFKNHGYLCFITVFILLITMLGVMQLLQFVRYSQRLYEEVEYEEDVKRKSKA